MDELLNEEELRDCYAYYIDERTTTTWDEARSDAERTLANIRADAWDEGEAAGLRRADYEYGQAGFENVRKNPYRDESKQDAE